METRAENLDHPVQKKKIIRIGVSILPASGIKFMIQLFTQ